MSNPLTAMFMKRKRIFRRRNYNKNPVYQRKLNTLTWRLIKRIKIYN
jgi:hypothetical protein